MQIKFHYWKTSKYYSYWKLSVLYIFNGVFYVNYYEIIKISWINYVFRSYNKIRYDCVTSYKKSIFQQIVQ